MKQTNSPILLIGILFLLLASSCVSRNNIAYFQGIEDVPDQQDVRNIRIQPGDLLSIIITAPELEAAEPFNNFRPMARTGQNVSGAGGGNTEPLDYLVADDGTIDIPTLGERKVTGMTPKELERKLKNKLIPFLEDPVVVVRIENFRISILGEVGNPGTFEVQSDDINLPQALGLAGDIALTGKRDNILVVRRENGVKSHAYLDLTDASVMNSPFYYLKQNDVVYIEPIGSRIQTTGYLNTVSSYLGIASVLVSLGLIFTR